MRTLILISLISPLLCFCQQSSKERLIHEKGFLIFTDASYYFIPFKAEEMVSIDSVFRGKNLGVGFDINYVVYEVDIHAIMDDALLFRKENFPDSLPEAYNSMRILPTLVEIYYERSKYDIAQGRETFRYIADILGRRVEYDYDFRDHIITDIIPIKE